MDNNKKIAYKLLKISKKLLSFNDNKLDEIIDVCEDLNIDYEIYEDYKGRGTYSSKTTGLSISRSEFRELKEELNDQDIDFSSDNLGMDMIVY